MNEFTSGLNTILSGDSSFGTSVDNLIDVINGIINDPRTIAKGEDFGNWLSLLAKDKILNYII